MKAVSSKAKERASPGVSGWEDPGGYPELASYLRQQSRQFVSAERVNARAPFAGRLALRVVLADGATFKARWLTTESDARTWHQLRGTVGEQRYLSSCLCRIGRMVVEEWIEGGTVAACDPSIDLLESAAGVLAKIHSLELTQRGAMPSTSVLERAEDNLRSLARAHAVSAADARALRGLLLMHPPAKTFHGLVHYDFCGENLVLHPSRGLVSIDHEWMRVDSLEFDLARAVGRWRLDTDAAQAFVAAYRKAGGVALTDSLSWWALTHDLFASEVRVRRGWLDAPATVKRLMSWIDR